jgi:phenylacetate-CoA ligase
LGSEVVVVMVGPGDTAETTQIDTRQKPIRLLDERKI